MSNTKVTHISDITINVDVCDFDKDFDSVEQNHRDYSVR